MKKIFNKTLLIAMILVMFSGLILYVYGAAIGVSGEFTGDVTIYNNYGGMSNPVYRVGLFREKDSYFDGITRTEDDVKKTYSQRIPTIKDNTLYFITDLDWTECGYDKDIRIGLGWYNGTTLMVNAGDQVPDINKRVLGMKNASSNSIWGSFLKDYTLNGDNNTKKFSDLSSGEWKNKIFDKATDTYGKSLGLWSYFLQDTNNDAGNMILENDAVNRINSFCEDPKSPQSQWTTEQKNQCARKYLEVLMSLYALAPNSIKGQWEEAINDYLDGSNLKEKPVTLVVDMCGAFTPGGLHNPTAPADRIIISTWDTFNYIGLTEQQYKIGVSTTLNVNNDTKNHMLQSIKKSMDASPTKVRITDSFNNKNLFSWGHAAFFKNYLSAKGQTGNSNALDWRPTDNTLQYTNALMLTETTKGFIIVGGNFNLMAPGKIKIDIKALPDEKVVTTDTINEHVDLTLKSVTSKKEIEAWDKILENESSVNVTF